MCLAFALALPGLVAAQAQTNVEGAVQPAAPLSREERLALMQQTRFEAVEFDSLATTGISGKRIPIRGYLARAKQHGGPGAVLNPACEGLMQKGGEEIKVKYRRMASFLWSHGITVLLVDGFNPRGYEESCSRRERNSISRLQDALGALAYLRLRGDVNVDKIFTVTWGGTGGIEGMNRDSPHLEQPGAGFLAAVMYYPDCRIDDRVFAPYAPIQVFVGEKDAWNPASRCQKLAQRQAAGSAAFDVKIYPDTYHSFDQPFGEPKMNAFNPKLGMVGRNAKSTEDSYRMIGAFLLKVIKGQAATVLPPAGS